MLVTSLYHKWKDTYKMAHVLTTFQCLSLIFIFMHCSTLWIQSPLWTCKLDEYFLPCIFAWPYNFLEMRHSLPFNCTNLNVFMYLQDPSINQWPFKVSFSIMLLCVPVFSSTIITERFNVKCIPFTNKCIINRQTITICVPQRIQAFTVPTTVSDNLSRVVTRNAIFEVLTMVLLKTL
jgi:hypothetical protein